MISPCLRAAGDAGVGAGSTSSTQTRVSWFNADKLLSGLRRINIFCGGFGAGKTEVAVNFSLRMREQGRRVSIADLDIVNLYFRSREVREQLQSQGINVIVPGGALANADLPIIVPEVRGAIEGTSSKSEARMTIETRNPNVANAEVSGLESSVQSPPVVVLDLGGDPAGAKVMASIAEGMRPEDYSGLFVLNSRRPFTATVDAAKRMMDGISSAARISVDRIVVNSHLIEETTPAVIEEGIALGEEVARATGAAIAFVAVQRELLARFDAAGCGHPVMVLDRLMLKPWEPSNWLGKYRIVNGE
jgi:predicted transcriptional regulator